MEKTISASLLLFLILMSFTCHSELLKKRFIVEFEQDRGVPEGSFSINRDLNALSCDSSCLAEMNNAGSILPPDNKSDRVKSRTPLSARFYSWIPVEAVSILTQGDDPFVIITMMLPGNGQQQNQPQNEQTNSSGQQSTVATTQIAATITGSPASGSGDGGESPEKNQHTYGLSCYVDSCHGVCKLRSSPRRTANTEQSLFSQVAEGLLTPVLYLAGIYFTPCAARSGQKKHPEGHRQPQHTYGFNCHIDSCHGECKFRPPSDY
ncbi:hypothetical protein [Endozoicomonas sp. 4G]|uniref:hypothetical protein n=1 Tax=Endozoicomonas sp. 4G TaxID=2872754 RepID=UPI00207865F5|nr:hypothetical protein [Endozoicomonas sp. 4G]